MPDSIKSVDEFLCYIRDNIFHKFGNFSALEQYPFYQIFYRGQVRVGEPEWSILPSVFRSGRKAIENKIYTTVLTECPQDFIDCKSHCEILSKMQHYGVPTRLVDITSNALVSLYFSVVDDKGDVVDSEDGVVFVIGAPDGHVKEFDSDTLSILSSLPRLRADEQEVIWKSAMKLMYDDETTKIRKFNMGTVAIQRLLHEIKKEKPQFEPIINPNDVLYDFIFTPQKTNPRIIRQHGAFIIFGLGHDGHMLDESLPEFDNYRNYSESFIKKNPIVLRKIRVEKTRKETILRELKRCGISHTSLFPELYKMGEYISIHNSIP